MAANHQHLRAFHAIALEGGVSRAARRLNVSQPTLSQQLKALEARHGVMLFESRRVPLSLTSAGRDLFALTQKLFATAADIDEVLGETAVPAAGIVRLGADSPRHAARLVDAMRRHAPQVELQVRMGNAQDVMRWLGEARVDAALASDPPADAACSYEPVATETLACALPSAHPLTALDAVPLAAFAGETLLLREPSSKTRAFTERALAEAQGRAPGDHRAAHPRDHPGGDRAGHWHQRVLRKRMPTRHANSLPAARRGWPRLSDAKLSRMSERAAAHRLDASAPPQRD